MNTDKYLTAAMVAEQLSCSIATVWRRCADGTLPKPHKFGHLTRWLASEISQYLKDAGTSVQTEPESP